MNSITGSIAFMAIYNCKSESCISYAGPLTWHRGWWVGGGIPQVGWIIIHRVVRWGWWRRWWHKIRKWKPLRKGIHTHGVKVLCCQHFGLIAVHIERLHKLVQGAVKGCLQDTSGANTRGQVEGVYQHLWTAIRGQLQSRRAVDN